MKENYIATRVAQLVAKKGLSEYRISTELGQCKTYLGKITSGKIKPSMNSFMVLCDYFEISPVEFFDPTLDKETIELVREIHNLSEKDKETVINIIEALKQREKNPMRKELKSIFDSNL